MTLKLPALEPATVQPHTASGYPEPYRSQVLPREKRRLGDACELTRIGVNLTTLPPGKMSAMRHWHSHEDELIYILEGEVVLITDDGEQTLTAGRCAGFKAGVADGHHLINRSGRAAKYLEISNRDAADMTSYPDIDLAWNLPGSRGRFTRKNGLPY